jgi:hypothetical protein
MYDKTIANHCAIWRQSENTSSEIRNKISTCLLSPLLFNLVLELLEQEDKKKEIKWIETGNEEDKLSLFAYNMVLYLNDPKDSTRKLLHLINTVSKVVGYKINIQK